MNTATVPTITTGSEKQIAWATEIVAKMATEAAAAGLSLPAVADARFWIDRRDHHGAVVAITGPDADRFDCPAVEELFQLAMTYERRGYPPERFADLVEYAELTSAYYEQFVAWLTGYTATTS